MLSDPTALQLQVDALNQRAHLLRHQDARQALQLCRQAHALALQADYQRGLAWSLLRLGVCQLILGLTDDDPQASLQQGLGLMRGLGDRRGEAEALNLLGNLLSERQAFDDALACHQQCLALRRSLGDAPGESGSLHNIALVHRDLGQLPEALEHVYRGLELAESQQDAVATAYALNTLGGLLDELGEQPQARAMFERALGLVAQTTDRALESTLRLNMGRLLTQAGDLAPALEQLCSALDLAHGTGNTGDMALAMLALAWLHQADGQFALAAPLLADALVLARQRGDRSLVAQGLLAQACEALAGGAPQAALPLLQQALDEAVAARAQPLVALAHERLSQALEATGELQAALAHCRAFHAASQRLHSVPAQRRIRALVSQHAVQSERQRSSSLADALAQARQAEQARARLLDELQAQAVLLQQLAREDGLTGVANRRCLDLQLPQELARARRFGHPLTVAMVDIDHFKSVNDLHSHAVGDAALCRVARLLREGCRASDLVGRYGGEEFLLVLVETAGAPAHSLCNQLRQQVAAHDWSALQPGLAPVTVSIGLAALQPGDDLLSLLGRADRQLYRAKQNGRNQVCA
jgi:diguanylate cyclase (GGDEF)-like protein